MKSRSLNTLSLAVIISMAPALQANEQENSSWLAPLSSTTIMYPLIGIGVSYLAYKAYNHFANSTELSVIAPWHEENRIIEKPMATATKPTETNTEELPLEAVYSIMQSGLDLFSQANGPQLVELHNALRNPALSSEEQEELRVVIEQLEQEAPALEQTVPPLLVYISLLSLIEQELHAQASRNARVVNDEFAATLETIGTIISYVSQYLDIYGQDIQSDIINEFNQQLEREMHEYSQANTL